MISWTARKNKKLVAIFAASARDAESAMAHLANGNVSLPILLYSLELVPDELSARFAKVTVDSSGARLLFRAIAQLFGTWVALSVVVWNRKSTSLLLKAAPFLFPPFRVLVMNENLDFFPGHPLHIANHIIHRTGAKCSNGLNILRGVWHLIQVWVYESFEYAGGLLHIASDFVNDRLRIIPPRIAEFFREIYVPGPLELAGPFAAPIARVLFSCMRGEKRLVVHSRRSRKRGAVFIEIPRGEWRLESILRTLHATETASDARWVVFEEGHMPEPWEELLPLFAEARTFAVTRQCYFRGWQKSVLVTAPFRELQPGEYTRVLAPVSRQMVFDREKLVALGLPKLRTAAANFMLLFWQAAAAGWRSYSVGSREAVRQSPSMPLAEAQFLQTLMVKPALANLRPEEPALSRGNIARSADGKRPFRGLPRILVLSPYLPFPLSHGGVVRIFNLCRALSADFDFVLACFREKEDEVDYRRLHEIFREIHVVSLDEKNFNPAWPEQVSGYESSTMRALIPKICAESQIDLLQIEYTQMAAYREAVPHIPAVLVEHDITFSLYRQLADREKTPSAERNYFRWLRFEKERLKAFDAVWTMSQADRELAVDAGASLEHVEVIANGVDIEKFHCEPDFAESQEILYVGSFRHLPNCIAFEHLRDTIMPDVWRSFPEATLTVVAGPSHEKHAKNLANLDPRITVHGFVSDMVPFYERCAVAVAPLEISAGTNIKVMEALGCQRAVVGTEPGCAGLELRHGVDAMICGLGPSFAAAICHLLRNPDGRRTMARQGRLTAERRFSWLSIKNKAAESYEKLLVAPEAIPQLVFTSSRK